MYVAVPDFKNVNTANTLEVISTMNRPGLPFLTILTQNSYNTMKKQSFMSFNIDQKMVVKALLWICNEISKNEFLSIRDFKVYDNDPQI